jgi:predicted RNase H-like nuclease (RuvC/YqgF family)
MGDALAEFRRTTTFGCLHGDADGPCDSCYARGLEHAYAACRAELVAMRERAESAERARDEFNRIIGRRDDELDGLVAQLESAERERDDAFKATDAAVQSGDRWHTQAAALRVRAEAAERRASTLRGALEAARQLVDMHLRCCELTSDVLREDRITLAGIEAALAEAEQPDNGDVCRCTHRAVDSVCHGPHPIHRGTALAEAARADG